MARAATVVSEREEKILGIIETARGKRAKFRDERITMAHGAGGKATQSLIEGLFVAGVRRRGAEPARPTPGEVAVDGVTLALDDGLLRRQAAALPGRLDRRARGQRHGQRPGRVRGASPGAEPLAGARGGADGR